MSLRLRLLSSLAVCIGFGLSGCATTGTSTMDSGMSSQAAEAVSELEREADKLLANRDKEGAIQMLMSFAKDNPDRKEPWVKLAKLHFNAAEYGRAIIATDEVLKRDGADRSMKSIRAVSGLRVASKSINELRGDVELKGNATADAVSLVKIMRDALGEDVLVPKEADKKGQGAGSVPRVRPSISSRVVRPRPVPPPKAPPRPASGGGSGNPFGALQ